MAKQILKTEGITIPVVTTLHGTDITLVGKDASYEPVVTFSINQSDGVTAVSEDLRRETYEHFKITVDSGDWNAVRAQLAVLFKINDAMDSIQKQSDKICN